MRVVVVGCGRVGAGLAAGLAEAGEVVAVVDKDPKAFERLGEDFTGQTVEGIGFDRDVLERAGVARADALVAVTGATTPTWSRPGWPGTPTGSRG
jgi:trk system potassium uptake protein